MVNTHFVNCTGLDDGADAGEHLTTARDIAIMSRELWGTRKSREYTTIWMDTVRDGQFGLSNTNKARPVLRRDDGTQDGGTRRVRGTVCPLRLSAAGWSSLRW